MPTPPGEAYLNDSRYDTQGEEDQSPVGKTSEAYPERDFVLVSLNLCGVTPFSVLSWLSRDPGNITSHRWHCLF